jgi:hypothetical protein
MKVLFPVLGSGGEPESEMVAVFGKVPEAVAVATTATVAVAPLAKDAGRVQLIGPLPVQVVPALGVADTKVMPDARASVRTTLLAAESPLFVTVML